MTDTIQQIPAVVDAVRSSFDAGRTRPLAWRKTQLRRLIEMIRREEAALSAALHADLGKSGFEGWVTELSFVANEADHALDHIDDWASPEKVHTPLMFQPAKSRIYPQPLGVALVIAPWNYPFHLSLGPLVGAVAAGNAAVIKPSEIAANTSAAIAELVPKYLDREAIAVIEGAIPETTTLLEQRFDHIFYTGNGTVGRIVMEAAAKHLTPVTLELGGKSPCIVDRSADLDVAARRIVWGKYTNAGQTCVAPDYILCERGVSEALLPRLEATIADHFGSDPRQSSDYGRIINDRHFRRLTELLDSGEIACGGETDAESRYIAPTILSGVTADSPVMADEIFGPILPIVEIDNLDAAIAFVNARPRPLALYVFTSESSVAERVLERTTSGGACVNDVLVQLGVPELPFGGVGASGMGAYHGRTGFETFSHRRAVLHKSNMLDVKLRYPPFDEAKVKWIRRLL